MPCQHMNVNLVGNEETGLRQARCNDCGQPLTRRIDPQTKEYVFEAIIFVTVYAADRPKQKPYAKNYGEVLAQVQEWGQAKHPENHRPLGEGSVRVHPLVSASCTGEPSRICHTLALST